MLCVVIKGPTYEEANDQITKALPHVDMVELRLDCFSTLDLSAIQQLRSTFSLPMIFTLRDTSQGGSYLKSEVDRQADLLALAKLQPEYIDLEYHLPPEFFAWISSQSPNSRVIQSYHNFEHTPKNIDALYDSMKRIPTHFYKIALSFHQSVEALKMLCCIEKAQNRLIGINIGAEGQLTRILSPIVGSPITYCSLEDQPTSTLGQLSVQTLISQYHYRSLDTQTKIYGLIGDPIANSIGHYTHNALIQALGINAVYIKMKVTKTELPTFIPFVKQLPIHGLSVTMPLKEDILPYLDFIDPKATKIGAVNTLIFKENHVFGYNTDGIGAVNVIEKTCRVLGKKIVIIGAGGAAKAIACECLLRGATVVILNRNSQKAQQISERFSCEGNSLEAINTYAKNGYDILINCTSHSLPISPDSILPHTIVMDICTYPKQTKFLQEAAQKNCTIIHGYKMFIAQAMQQCKLWYNDLHMSEEHHRIFENKTLDHIQEL